MVAKPTAGENSNPHVYATSSTSATMRPRRIATGLPWKSNTCPSSCVFCQKYFVLRTFAHAE